MDAIEFDVRTPGDDDTIRAHVAHALSLGLPEIRDFEYPWGEPLHIVANGPSAKNAPLTGKTLALNGALKLFETPPTYWAACDPQPMVLDFLQWAPKETVYLVASKCHPSVLERLNGKTVILWHVDDEPVRDLLQGRPTISPFVSITSTVPELMVRLGWRDLHFWGWDGCYLDGSDHAVPQAHNGAQDVEVELNGVRFPSTHSWALEAQNAMHRFVGWPFPVHVHGPGFMPRLLNHYHPTKVVIDAPPKLG